LTSYVSGSEYLELLDWRRRVSELFVDLRRRRPDAETRVTAADNDGVRIVISILAPDAPLA